MKIRIDFEKKHFYFLVAMIVLVSIAGIMAGYPGGNQLNVDGTIPAGIGYQELRFISNGTHSVDANEDGIIDYVAYAYISGPWVQSGPNIYYTDGNVSIGSTNFSYKLNVDGLVNAEKLCIGGDCVDVWDDLTEVLYNPLIQYYWNNITVVVIERLNCTKVVGAVTSNVACSAIFPYLIYWDIKGSTIPTEYGEITCCKVEVY